MFCEMSEKQMMGNGYGCGWVGWLLEPWKEMGGVGETKLNLTWVQQQDILFSWTALHLKSVF